MNSIPTNGLKASQQSLSWLENHSSIHSAPCTGQDALCLIVKMILNHTLQGGKKSFFANSTGLDNGGSRSLVSARNLVWLADVGLENEAFKKIVATRAITLQDPQKRFIHSLYNNAESESKVFKPNGKLFLDYLCSFARYLESLSDVFLESDCM